MNKMKITKTAANLRHPNDLRKVICLLGKGEYLTLLNDETRKFNGYVYALVYTTFGAKGYVALHLIIDTIDFIAPAPVDFPHYIGKKQPETPNDLAVRVQPILFQNFQGGYIKRFEQTVNFLQVETAAAFKPDKFGTYCNVAAYQFAYQMGCNLPRIWWNDKEAQSEGVVLFGKNVHEVSANGLLKWLFSKDAKNEGWMPSVAGMANNNFTVAVVQRRGAGHIAVIRPDGGAWEAGRKNKSANYKWGAWFNDHAKNVGAQIFTCFASKKFEPKNEKN